jgi:putative addiction module component (TIGR02574 family)
MAVSRDELLRMSVDERLALIETIWSTLSDESESLGVSDVTRKELDRRLAAYYRNPDDTESWERVRARLEAQD